MKWSWRIGTIAGIGLYVHATFWILLGWVALTHYLPRRSLSEAVHALAFILVLFSVVVLHELGHALTAKRFGIRTRDITLLPIGGLARLERMPEEPWQELLVALAGPLVNVLLAAPLVVTILPAQGLAGALDEEAGLLTNFMWINVGLAVFNLLPAFPMDGGRVLRALLAMRMDYVRATQVAAMVGQGMALLFGFFGLFHNPFLVFIALFVWIGASQEASMVQMKAALGGIPISGVMVTDFRTLSPYDPLRLPVDHILAGFQHDFPVVDDGRVVGLLTRSDLLAALAQRGQDAVVGDVMKQNVATADPSEMLESAIARLQDCDCHSMPVVRGDQLVGLLTMDNLGEFLMIQSALRGKRRSGRFLFFRR